LIFSMQVTVGDRLGAGSARHSPAEESHDEESRITAERPLSGKRVVVFRWRLDREFLPEEQVGGHAVPLVGPKSMCGRGPRTAFDVLDQVADVLDVDVPIGPVLDHDAGLDDDSVVLLGV
jgi:hypothetical protein